MVRIRVGNYGSIVSFGVLQVILLTLCMWDRMVVVLPLAIVTLIFSLVCREVNMNALMHIEETVSHAFCRPSKIPLSRRGPLQIFMLMGKLL